MNNCQKCGKETMNKKYCSRSCSTQLNNIGTQRNKRKERLCYKCQKKFTGTESKRAHYCALCAQIINDDYAQRILSMTLGFFKEKAIASGIHPSWRFSEVRGFNRLWNAHMTKSCQVCGYDKHVELAHIKPLSEFDDNSLLIEINCEENVRGLCPNHHWELDHDLLKPDSIPVLKRSISIEKLIRCSHDLRGRIKK